MKTYNSRKWFKD